MTMLGKTPWNKGKKMSDEQRKKLSEAHLKNPTRYWLGKKRSFPNRKKPKPFSAEHRANLSKAGKGKNAWSAGRTSEYAGEKHHAWIDGRSKGTRAADKQHAAYRTWMREVYKRDGKQCRVCQSHTRLETHHIKPYAKFPEHRYDVGNGVILCSVCHRITAGKEHLFETYFTALLKNGFNSVKLSQETTPSQQERLRKALRACVTVRGE